MIFRTLPNGDTFASPNELPLMLEAEEGYGSPNQSPLIYDDGVNPSPSSSGHPALPGHNPTIGYGFNLRSNAYLALVLRLSPLTWVDFETIRDAVRDSIGVAYKRRT